ncbi:MAG: hypothetical protein ABI678_08960 [Kofleriaceae bacterium]
MRKLLLTVLLVACNGDDSDVTPIRTPCEQLREHLIDLRLADASPKVDKDAHRAAMRGAFGETFFSTCSQMSEDGRACASSATTLSDATACGPKEAK